MKEINHGNQPGQQRTGGTSPNTSAIIGIGILDRVPENADCYIFVTIRVVGGQQTVTQQHILVTALTDVRRRGPIGG